MSFRTRVTLLCDYWQCPERMETSVGTAWDARKEAAKAGWAYGRRRDFCPDHSDQTGSGSAPLRLKREAP